MTAKQGIFRTASLMLTGALAMSMAPLAAQGLETVDPDSAFESGAIDGDLAPVAGPSTSPAPQPEIATVDENAVTYSPTPPTTEGESVADWSEETVAADPAQAATTDTDTTAQVAQVDSTTYAEDDLIGAAEGVFGKGAEGLARMIEKMLKEQGQPNAYIVGREGGGAFAVGVRYGSGTMHHKVEGERKVYWTGPSIGFDVGANAANTFVLVYNLYDSEELFERYPSGEGQAYVVGGLTASYLRKGDVVLIPIRMGAGLRLGINAGYMKFSKKQRWLPF